MKDYASFLIAVAMVALVTLAPVVLMLHHVNVSLGRS